MTSTKIKFKTYQIVLISMFVIILTAIFYRNFYVDSAQTAQNFFTLSIPQKYLLESVSNYKPKYSSTDYYDVILPNIRLRIPFSELMNSQFVDDENSMDILITVNQSFDQTLSPEYKIYLPPDTSKSNEVVIDEKYSKHYYSDVTFRWYLIESINESSTPIALCTQLSNGTTCITTLAYKFYLYEISIQEKLLRELDGNLPVKLQQMIDTWESTI